MSPAVADPSDTDTASSVVFSILVKLFGRCQRGYFRLSQLSFPLSFCHSVLLEEESADFATPGWSVKCQSPPGLKPISELFSETLRQYS